MEATRATKPPGVIFEMEEEHFIAPNYTTPKFVVLGSIEPAWSGWRPWRGRTSRWWYEIHSRVDVADEVDEEAAVVTFTHAYNRDERGSGGAFTMRRCIMRAALAMDLVAQGLEDRYGSNT